MEDDRIVRDRDDLVTALLQLNRVETHRMLVGASRAGGVLAVEDLVSSALERIGVLWETGEVSLAQVYLTAKICEELLGSLVPTESTIAEPTGELALLVLEDQHVLGASIVRSVLACAGHPPVRWGSLDVATATARVIADKPAVLLVSTLMLRSALAVGRLVREIRRAGSDTKVIVGGAPFRFDSNLWQEVGADAMGRTAADALALTRASLKRAA
jgi:methanogenic corrinoid protein MtbC1